MKIWRWELPSKGTIFSWMGISAVLAVVSLVVWFCFWVSFVDRHELGFVFDKLTGKIETVDHPGWVIRTPLRYSVHTVDLRPYQVQISANARILNAKLVRFDPAGIETFVSWHGRDAADSLHNLLEILKCYAFDRDEGRDCPFLAVISVLAPNQGEIAPSVAGGKAK